MMKLHRLVVLVAVIASTAGAVIAQPRTGPLIIADPRLEIARIGGVELAPGVEQALAEVAVAQVRTIPLDARAAMKTTEAMRAWVGRSMNLQAAERRVSQLTKRTSFTQTVKQDLLRMPLERGADSLPAIQVSVGIPLVYREGPGYLKFQKLVEERTDRAIPNDDAIRQATALVTEMGLLRASGAERVGQAEVIQRRITADGGAEGRQDDFLVQQDVVFPRLYESLPVVNSRVVVGLRPSRGDVVLLKSLNWTPLAEQKATALSDAVRKTQRTASASDLRARLVGRVRAVVGSRSRAKVNEVKRAWFQTADGLVPILLFQADVQFRTPDGMTLVEPVVDAMNLAGSDDVFLPPGGGELEPPAAPPATVGIGTALRLP